MSPELTSGQITKIAGDAAESVLLDIEKALGCQYPDEQFDALHVLLADELRLPISWVGPPNENWADPS